MPVRKIKTNNFSVTGSFYSFKNKRHIEFESSLEVKPSKVIKDKKVFLKQKFEQIERYLHDNDMDFKLFTKYYIRTQRLEYCKTKIINSKTYNRSKP